MSKLFAGGGIVDWILALMAVEAGLLAVLHSRKLPGLPLMEGISVLAGGVALLLALRCALRGSPWGTIAIWLILALAAHLWDLRSRIAQRIRLETLSQFK
jgi:hypothetical protein